MITPMVAPDTIPKRNNNILFPPKATLATAQVAVHPNKRDKRMQLLAAVTERSYRESERCNPEQSVKPKKFDVDIVNPAKRSFERDGTIESLKQARLLFESEGTNVMQTGSDSNTEIPCVRCHHRYPKSQMVYGSPLGGFHGYWLCSSCYSRLARTNTFAGAGIVAAPRNSSEAGDTR